MSKAKSVAVPSRGNGYESVSVRPIDNGYLICRNTDKGYSEVYSATKPKIEVPGAPKSASPKSPSGSSAPKGMAAVKKVANASNSGKKRY